MAAAVVAAIVLTLLLPDSLRLAPRWVLSSVEGHSALSNLTAVRRTRRLGLEPRLAQLRRPLVC